MTRNLSEIDRDLAAVCQRKSILRTQDADLDALMYRLFEERAVAQEPVDPPPTTVVELSADTTTINPGDQSPLLTVYCGQLAPTEIRTVLQVTRIEPLGSDLGIVIDWPGPVIPAGGLSSWTYVRVTRFPPPGESVTFDVSLTGAQGAVIGVQSTVTFRVDGPPLPPPPEPLHVSLWADSARLTMPENGGTVDLVVNLSRPAETDIVIPLQFSGDAKLAVDYDCDTFVVVGSGMSTGVRTVVSLNDTIVEGNEDIVIAIAPSDAYVIDMPSVLITLVDDDEPPPPPPPDPDPSPVPYKVREQHPRLYWHDQVRPRVIAAPTLLKNVAGIADSDATTRLVDTPLCCATLWLLSKEGGLPAGPKYLYTAEQYRDRAIAKALVMAKTLINLAGTHYGTNHLHPLAILYDWLWNDMAPGERATIRATLEEALTAAYTLKRVDAAGKTVAVQNPNIYVGGYNDNAGSGMTPALAVYGETEVDWVQTYWNNVWWSVPPDSAKGIGGYYNREYELKWLVGGGNPEDWGYFENQILIRAARQAWETATGDTKSLDYPFLSKASLLYLHQSVALPYNGKPRLHLMPTYGNGNNWLLHGAAFWLAAGTGSSDPQIAALSAWLLPQVQYAGQPAFDEFFWRCVVGDPRVKPQSPAELGIPLDYFVESTGLYYDRTGWGDADTRVFFGCSEQMYRSTASGSLMICAGGRRLIADRSEEYSHGYSGMGRSCLPGIRVEKTGKFLEPLSGDGTPRRVKVASFRKVGNAVVADLMGLYASAVTRMTRSFEFDRAANVMTITDECTPKPGFIPTSLWPTPELPVMQRAGMLFSNGIATADVTWDAPPSEIRIVGGETGDDMALDYDGTFYNVAGLKEFKLLSRDQQIAAGGFYTVYVTPQQVAGVYRLVTRIQVKVGL